MRWHEPWVVSVERALGGARSVLLCCASAVSIMRLSDEVMGGNVRTEILHEIGEQLEAHIRLEERVVFPLVEESLSGAALTELAARLEVKEADPWVEPWVPAEELSYAPWPGPGDSEGGGYD